MYNVSRPPHAGKETATNLGCLNCRSSFMAIQTRQVTSSGKAFTAIIQVQSLPKITSFSQHSAACLLVQHHQALRVCRIIVAITELRKILATQA